MMPFGVKSFGELGMVVAAILLLAVVMQKGIEG